MDIIEVSDGIIEFSVGETKVSDDIIEVTVGETTKVSGDSPDTFIALSANDKDTFFDTIDAPAQCGLDLYGTDDDTYSLEKDPLFIERVDLDYDMNLFQNVKTNAKQLLAAALLNDKYHETTALTLYWKSKALYNKNRVAAIKAHDADVAAKGLLVAAKLAAKLAGQRAKEYKLKGKKARAKDGAAAVTNKKKPKLSSIDTAGRSAAAATKRAAIKAAAKAATVAPKRRRSDPPVAAAKAARARVARRSRATTVKKVEKAKPSKAKPSKAMVAAANAAAARVAATTRARALEAANAAAAAAADDEVDVTWSSTRRVPHAVRIRAAAAARRAAAAASPSFQNTLRGSSW